MWWNHPDQRASLTPFPLHAFPAGRNWHPRPAGRSLPHLLALLAAILWFAWAILAPTPASATSVVFSLTTPDGPNVASGSEVTLNVTATFDTVMQAVRFEIHTPDTGMATVISRTVAPELRYVGPDPDDPYPFLPELGLPYVLDAANPLKDVLAGLTWTEDPGNPLDGIQPGTDVLLETLTVRLAGAGLVTITLAAPDACETQSDPDGRLFDSVTLEPGMDSVTFHLAMNADSDGDGDVDQADFGTFQRCLFDPSGPLAPGCGGLDFDGDADIDLDDFAQFAACARGPNIPADPDCRGQFSQFGAPIGSPGAAILSQVTNGMGSSEGMGTRWASVGSLSRAESRPGEGVPIAGSPADWLNASAAPQENEWPAASDPALAASETETIIDNTANDVMATTYESSLYGLGKNYSLPQSHRWVFGVMGPLEGGTQPGFSDNLNWNPNLDQLINSTYLGKYMLDFHPKFVKAFGLTLQDGPQYPPELPPAGVRLIQYNGPCIPPFRNPLTPEPPTFAAAKAAADGWCASHCGEGFEMTDFDINQWRYACYGYSGKGYQIVTWGGSRCEKIVGEEVISCAWLTGFIEIRNNLGNPASSCPTCDLDADGTITLQDLTLARNQLPALAFRGERQTFPVIFDSRTTVDQTQALTQIVTRDNIDYATYMEITHWNATTPVDCNNPSSHLGFLETLTKSNPTDPTLFGQALANIYCENAGGTYCAQDSLGYTIGRCRINKDGTHSIRVSAGYCMYCL